MTWLDFAVLQAFLRRICDDNFGLDRQNNYVEVSSLKLPEGMRKYEDTIQLY